MKNLKEFKELIERYETISLDEIQKEWKNQKLWHGDNEYIGFNTIQKLMGFGSQWSCTLCKAVKTDLTYCGDCVYGKSFGCINDGNEKTYQKIEDAKTPKGLLTALRNRAKHLRTTYKEIL